MVAKSDNNARVHGSAHRGTFSGVRAVRATFRGAFGISLLLHAVAFASVWRALGTNPPNSTASVQSDVWVGTTVSVIAEQAGHSEPSIPEQTPGTIDQAQQEHAAPPAAGRSVAIQKPATRELTAERMEAERQRLAQTAARAQIIHPRTAPAKASTLPDANEKSSAAGTDLKKAMLEAANHNEGGAGTFGAVGVDLRERRLPAAITRALPVAIGAQPGWWRGKLGPLGGLKFEVALDDSGKIQNLDIDDETTHVWASRIVRRVGRLLAVGRYALPASTPGARQRFELTLELEQRPASTSITAEAGDAVDMGWEAPTPSNPGKAHIQEAQGRTLRATLRVLPAAKANFSLQARPSHGTDDAEPAPRNPE